MDNLHVNDRMVCLYTNDSRLIIHERTNAETYVFSQLKRPYSFLLGNRMYANKEHFSGFVQANVIQNIFLPIQEADVRQYPYLEVLQDENVEDWMENDWIIVGSYV